MDWIVPFLNPCYRVVVVEYHPMQCVNVKRVTRVLNVNVWYHSDTFHI